MINFKMCISEDVHVAVLILFEQKNTVDGDSFDYISIFQF